MSSAKNDGCWARAFKQLAKPRFTVVVIDYGVKRNILRALGDIGAKTIVLPASATADEVMAHKPDGVLLSNGPGDPAATGLYAAPQIKKLVDSGTPVMGVCLGHQMLGLALGAKTMKMAQGHHGANHPVQDKSTGKVEIVSMNHGFAIDRASLPKGVKRNPRLALRRLQLRHRDRRQAGLQRAISPRSLARPARQPLPLRALRQADGSQEKEGGLNPARLGTHARIQFVHMRMFLRGTCKYESRKLIPQAIEILGGRFQWFGRVYCWPWRALRSGPVSPRPIPTPPRKSIPPPSRAASPNLSFAAVSSAAPASSGDWQVKAEASRGLTDWWRPALVAEWESQGGAVDFTAFAVESVFDFTATRAWPVHFGGYVEYEWAQSGPDQLELKLLMEHRRGPFDLRLNLIGTRLLGASPASPDDNWEFGYAAEAAFAFNDDFALGVQGFGDAGANDNFGLNDQAQYWGPFAQIEAGRFNDGELELQLGYLAGFGQAEADGIFRVKLEYEFGGHDTDD